MWVLSCGLWDLFPWPGIEFQPPSLGTQNLNHWTTREVSGLIFYWWLHFISFLKSFNITRYYVFTCCVRILIQNLNLSQFTILLMYKSNVMYTSISPLPIFVLFFHIFYFYIFYNPKVYCYHCYLNNHFSFQRNLINNREAIMIYLFIISKTSHSFVYPSQ